MGQPTKSSYTTKSIKLHIFERVLTINNLRCVLLVDDDVVGDAV